MAKTILMSNTVTDTYKNTAKAISEVDLTHRHVIKNSLVEIMKQSFLYGASIYGTNFIA